MTMMLAERRILLLAGAEPPVVTRPDATSVAGAPRDIPVRILLVDDDEMLRSAVAELLDELGFDIVGQAEDGERGVALAARFRPDVILMDLRMPGIDGIEASRRIRDADDRVQVVMYSAYGDAGFQADARAAGVNSFLIKGCGPDVLADVLRSAGMGGRPADLGDADTPEHA